MSDWIGDACEELLGLRTGEGVWGYRKDRSPCVEATALACLGLLGSFDQGWRGSCPAGGRPGSPPGPDPVLLGIQARSAGASPSRDPIAAVGRGAQWLSALQGPDGSLGASPGLPGVGWATPFAVLVWDAVGRYAESRTRACEWLLRHSGQTLPRDPSVQLAVQHDTSLVGWPWVEGTHSWLEPTAMAILALSREGLHGHPRVLEGVRLIIDRALPHGGWNYGNKSVFGTELRPHPGPTGLALLALATRGDGPRPRCVDPAIGYLARTLPGVDSPSSLGWGVLGMRAWDAAPAGSGDWLGRSWERHSGRLDVACGLGLILLAAAGRGPEYLGVHARGAIPSEANRGSPVEQPSGGIGR